MSKIKIHIPGQPQGKGRARSMTPYVLRVFMHFYITSEPFIDTRTAAYARTIDRLLKEKVICHTSETQSGIELTELGRAWLSAILGTPIPERKYVDHHGEVVQPL